MLDLGLLGGCAAEGPAAGPLTSANPAAGGPVASATDAPTPADVFHSLVAAMAGTDVEPHPHGLVEGAQRARDARGFAMSQRDKDDDANNVAPVAPMWIVLRHEPAAIKVTSVDPAADKSTQPAPKDDSTQRAAIVAANMAVAADVAAAKTNRAGTPASATTSAVHPERHAVPVERADPFGVAGEAKRVHGSQGGPETGPGEDTPKDGDASQGSFSRRVEFARALQTGVEIAAPVAGDLRLKDGIEQDVPVPVRTALPAFAGPATAAPRGRAATPAIIGAPTPPTSLPLTIVSSPMRDMTTMALRLSTPNVPVFQTPVDEVAPQIVQTLRVAWSRGAGEAQIRLDPRQFGDLTVTLRVESGQVVARVQADQPAVREWLQANQRTLQDGLAEHQLRLGRLEVVAPGDEARDATDSHGRRREEPADEPAARRPRRRESTGSFEVVA